MDEIQPTVTPAAPSDIVRRFVGGVGQVTLFLLGGDKQMKRFVANALDAQRPRRVRSINPEQPRRFKL